MSPHFVPPQSKSIDFFQPSCPTELVIGEKFDPVALRETLMGMTASFSSDAPVPDLVRSHLVYHLEFRAGSFPGFSV